MVHKCTNKMSESPKHNVEREKPDTEEYVLCDTFYIRDTNR